MMISVIIPVYNSSQTIGKLIEGLIENFKGKFNYEVIIVNDGSKDDSEKICKDLVNKQNNVSLYSLSKNFGEHNAVMAGLNNSKGDFAIIIDDDLQNPFNSIIDLVDYGIKNSSKYDVVYADYSNNKYGLLKRLGSKINDITANIILKKPKELYLSSFKIINRFTINEIIKHKSPYVYIDGLILGITNNIGSIKVEHNERQHGQSGYTITRLIRLWLSMFTGFSIIPLRISMVIGILLSLFGLLYSIITIIEKIFYKNYPIGYASIIIFITIFSGTILIALGILGEYVGRIFLSLNQKPQYIIKKVEKNLKN